MPFVLVCVLKMGVCARSFSRGLFWGSQVALLQEMKKIQTIQEYH